MKPVFTKLPAANLSVTLAKCTYAVSHQEFLGMVVDSTGVRPSPSKLETITKMPRPTDVNDLRASLRMVDFLR